MRKKNQSIDSYFVFRDSWLTYCRTLVYDGRFDLARLSTSMDDKRHILMATIHVFAWIIDIFVPFLWFSEAACKPMARHKSAATKCSDEISGHQRNRMTNALKHNIENTKKMLCTH